jgi:DNA processing protein
MGDDILTLLALRHAAGGRRVSLAKALLKDGLAAVASAPRWQPDRDAWVLAEQQRAAVDALDIKVLPIGEIPKGLLQAQPPVALFVRGDPHLLQRVGVAVVGSREASAAGEQWAERVTEAALAAGKVIVSGGARGIDAVAHRTANARQAPSVAYLGVAADKIYPAEHRRLFEALIATGGALVSEHPPRTVTFAVDHAKRNRLIVLHSERVFIAEAAAKSGALGTAQWARKLGRPIVIPLPAAVCHRAGLEELLAHGHATVDQALQV